MRACSVSRVRKRWRSLYIAVMASPFMDSGESASHGSGSSGNSQSLKAQISMGVSENEQWWVLARASPRAGRVDSHAVLLALCFIVCGGVVLVLSQH